MTKKTSKNKKLGDEDKVLRGSEVSHKLPVCDSHQCFFRAQWGFIATVRKKITTCGNNHQNQTSPFSDKRKIQSELHHNWDPNINEEPSRFAPCAEVNVKYRWKK